MNRDGAKISLWQNTTNEYFPKYTSLPDMHFDVVIVGGGITGITTGLLLQKKGLQCLIAEAKNICFGTTGGTTAHLNTFMDTNYNTIKKDFGEEDAQVVHLAARQALSLFKQHVEEYNIDCGYEEKDGYVFSQNMEETSLLNDILQSSQNAGAEVDFAPGIPVPLEFAKAIVYKRQAQLHPARYTAALAKEFENLGGVLLHDCRVTNLETEDELTVQTSLGTVKANNLIYATHTPPGVNLLHFRTAPYRSYVIAVKLKDDQYPIGLAYDMKDPYHYFRTQEIDGEKYLIAGGEDHKTAHEENTENCFRKLEAYVRKYYNIEKVTYQWSSQFFEPSDGLAYIGNLPGNPENVYVASGYGGNGITYSHVAAILLTDLITKGSSPYKELFDPNRIKMVAGFANFVKENVDVVKEFITKRIEQEKITGFSELTHGEGKLVKYEGESIALYKDDEGNIHAIDPVCPHAKCMVGWNSAEKSWDCPCHGSRFSYDGELLTGPSKRNLEKVDITE
jgi:glycine/D-amino acid oxidase-like deaminating enzyme/nitrite reductase/ring-hydroxylating ferredoxin subunit